MTGCVLQLPDRRTSCAVSQRRGARGRFAARPSGLRLGRPVIAAKVSNRLGQADVFETVEYFGGRSWWLLELQRYALHCFEDVVFEAATEQSNEELIRCDDLHRSETVGNACRGGVRRVLGDDEVGAAGDGCGKV